jgi:hypothetical protein
MQGSVDIDKVVRAFTAIKDARTAKRHAWEEADQALEKDMGVLRTLMLQLLNANGARSIATDHGTVYRRENIKPSAADWTSVYDWIQEDPERFEILEKRLKSTFVKQYMDENEGNLPPGVNVHREYEAVVRKPTSTGSKS